VGRCGEHTADPGVPTYCFYSTGIETTPQRYDYYGELGDEISWDVHTGPGDATCTKASLEVCKHWPSTVSAIDFGAVKHTDMIGNPDVLAALHNALPEMPPGAPPPPPAPPGAPPPPHLPPDMPASIWPPPPPGYFESVIADMQKAVEAICPDLSDEELEQGVLYLTLGPYGDVCPPAVSCLLQHDASPSQASRECASKGYIASPGCIAGFYMNLTESIALPCPDGHFCPENYMCAVPCRPGAYWMQMQLTNGNETCSVYGVDHQSPKRYRDHWQPNDEEMLAFDYNKPVLVGPQAKLLGRKCGGVHFEAFCAGGSYCPTPREIIRCPSGALCRPGQSYLHQCVIGCDKDGFGVEDRHVSSWTLTFLLLLFALIMSVAYASRTYVSRLGDAIIRWLNGRGGNNSMIMRFGSAHTRVNSRAASASTGSREAAEALAGPDFALHLGKVTIALPLCSEPLPLTPHPHPTPIPPRPPAIADG